MRFTASLATAALAAAMAFGVPAQAANFSFTGSLASPEEVLLFNFNVGVTSDITLRTYSYAGGTNAEGTVIARGGFDPILALFNASGALIDQNDDGGANVPADINGLRFDTFLFLDDLAAGSYTVSVSVYPNFANGPSLSDGFRGATSFGGRTAEWAFDVLNAGEAQQVGVPEPASLALFGLGLLGLGAIRRRAI